jgi:hypothetical protein
MSKKVTAMIFLLLLVLLSTAMNASAVTLVIPDMTAPLGPVQIPVNVDNSAGIAGLQLTVTYDASLLECTGAQAGTLTEGWVIIPNSTVTGQITVGGFSPTLTELTGGSGSLTILVCNVKGTTQDNVCFSYWKVTNGLAATVAECASNCDCGILNQCPIMPGLVSPSNGATGLSTSPTLDWGDVLPATSYKVQVCTDSSCLSIVRIATPTDSEWTVTPPLSRGKLYYWRVKAVNACGLSQWSSMWHFTIGLPDS